MSDYTHHLIRALDYHHISTLYVTTNFCIVTSSVMHGKLVFPDFPVYAL